MVGDDIIMNEKFLIGELSKLFNISTDTLRHYDKLDILKPQYNYKNNYRYYDIRSFFKLSRILFLKNLNISLSEIKMYLKNKNTNNLLILLKKKDEEISMKILHLMNLKNKITSKITLLETAHKELNVVKIKNISKRLGIFLDIKNLNSEYELKQAFKQSEEYLKLSSWLTEGQIYTSLSKEKMLDNSFNEYSYFIEVLSTDVNLNQQVYILPQKQYACIAFLGPYTEIIKHYEFLITWIKENNYTIDGPSIEKNIVDYDFSDSEDEYVSEIQIPIK